jgi:hypothetical protein
MLALCWMAPVASAQDRLPQLQQTAPSAPSSAWTPPGATASVSVASTIPYPATSASGPLATPYLALQPPAPASTSENYLYDESQSAPGALDELQEPAFENDSMPNYYYESWYYNTWDVGARALADYAPAGYDLEREEQDAPGDPMYIRLRPPARPSAGEAGKFVTLA